MNCFLCKGQMKNGFTTHTVNLKKCIIVIKNVPCNECEQCGETYYDDVVATQLEKIVDRLRNFPSEIAVVDYSDKVA